MGNSSDIIDYHFREPAKGEFRDIFLKYALMPYGILLLLIPAYFQFKTILVFAPLIVISIFQIIIYFYLKAKFNIYIYRIVFNQEEQTLQLEYIDRQEKRQITVPNKTLNIQIIIRTNQMKAFSYFDVFDSRARKKILRQYFTGEWTVEKAKTLFEELANSIKVHENKQVGF